MLLDDSRSREQQECLTALFLTDPLDDRNKLTQIKGSRVDGTCEWIETNDLYNSWRDTRSQLLWVSGGPGKGKTMLSIFLAEELERYTKESQDAFCIQYFCDNKEEKRNTAVAILRGLIWQILKCRPQLNHHILPSFKDRDKSHLVTSFNSLWSIFETIVRDPILGIAYCIIDGLDECDEASLDALLKKFKALFSMKSTNSSPCRLNLIAVSRDLPDVIPEVLSGFPRIRLDPDADTEVNGDITRFIEAKVDEISTHKHYPQPLRVYVKDVFLKRAEGTFLWVGIVANELRKYTPSEVENALEQFPSGLEALYARLLLQISRQRRETAAKILGWVVMAVSPLSLSELSAAIEPSLTTTAGMSRVEVMADQVTFCGHFLITKGDEVGLVHQSAKDYLLRKTPDANPDLEFFRIDRDQVNLEIVRRCLSYLQNGALADRAAVLKERHHYTHDVSRLKAFPLLSYAAFAWPIHARFLSRSEDIFDLSHPFYSSKSRVFELWVISQGTRQDTTRPGMLLRFACQFGIIPLVENLLSRKSWVNKLKHFAHVSRKNTYETEALFSVIRGGDQKLVHLLLEKGADVNARDADGITLLHCAILSRSEMIVRLLLENGVDTEARDKEGNTPLLFAISEGDKVIVRLLLEKGADIDVKNNNGQTALMSSIWAPKDTVVQLLLEKGVDINARANGGQTALLFAVEYDREMMVRLLLEKGADVNMRREDETTALTSAISRKGEMITRLLLKKDADVSVEERNWYTTMFFAKTERQETIIQLLLEKGADINARYQDGRTQLQKAILWRQEGIARLLLEKGATFSVTDDLGMIVLSENDLEWVRDVGLIVI